MNLIEIDLSHPDYALTTRVTEMEVCALPENNINYPHYAIKVEYRGLNRWAVTRDIGLCLGSDGLWSFESMPSNRTDEWKATHRFDLGTALRMAREIAPTMTCNGFTVQDVLAEERTRGR